MLRAFAHQDVAGVIGHLAPFVKVEGDRVGALDAAQPRRNVARQHAQRATGTIDMEPEVLFPCQRGQCVEIVDGPDIDGAGRADDQKRLQAGRFVGLDGLHQLPQVHLVTVIHGNGA